MEVRKGARSATAFVTVTVVEGNPPAVWVDVASLKIKTSERLTLEGYYKTRLQPTKVAWSCSQEQGVLNNVFYVFVSNTGIRDLLDLARFW